MRALTFCFFASDIHGSVRRYEKLLSLVADERPQIVLLGGDLLPSALMNATSSDETDGDFLEGFLAPRLITLKSELGSGYPRIFVILGNDDPRVNEHEVQNMTVQGLWDYVHNRCIKVGDHSLFGYSHVPPSPFLLKDWERYDVSRYVDPGAVSPEEGFRTVPPSSNTRYATIKDDLALLTKGRSLDRGVFLFHAPPYKTNLDRAALDGKMVEHVPLDVHIGSIAIRRFIEEQRPLLTLHGHVHESARITGEWKDRIGRTTLLSAAHDGPELALIRFDLEDPSSAVRELAPVS